MNKLKHDIRVRFYDGKGQIKVEEFLVANQNELESNADLYAESLAIKWGNPVSWRRLNGVRRAELTLKVKIDPAHEEAFRFFCNEKGWLFDKIRYAKELEIWCVDLHQEDERSLLHELPFVLYVTDMPSISVDYSIKKSAF